MYAYHDAVYADWQCLRCPQIDIRNCIGELGPNYRHAQIYNGIFKFKIWLRRQYLSHLPGCVLRSHCLRVECRLFNV